jgi:hypothetical protein
MLSSNYLTSAINAVKSLAGGSSPLVNIVSTVDNNTYRVRDMSDKMEAANLLARVRIKMSNFMIKLKSDYPDKGQIIRLSKNFDANPNRFYEATPDADHTSYSVNKGEEVHLCLRQRSGSNESLISENILMFVSIHEMAHMITKTIGHGPDFWNNFGWLLKEAEKGNFYKYQDFASQPVPYCGVTITDQPKYDEKKDEGFQNMSGSIVGTMTPRRQ